MGWKVVTIIGAHSRGGAPVISTTGRGQPEKTFRTVDGPLLHIVMKAYHLHVFLSLANLNMQNSLKHSNIRRGKAELSTGAMCSVHREPRLTDSKTEPSTPLPPPAPERTNKNRSLRKKCERVQFSTRTRPAERDVFQRAWTPNMPLLQNYVKIPVLESILERTVGYVQVCIIMGAITAITMHCLLRWPCLI